MMRPVKMVRFQTGKREIFGRSLAVLRKQDGFEMSIWTESGVLSIKDHKEGGAEVLTHITGCDVYPDDEPELGAQVDPGGAPAAKVAAPASARGKEAPQVR